MENEAINYLIKIVLPVFALSLTALFAFRRYLKEKNDKKRLILNAILGDLENILQHYSYQKDFSQLVGKSKKNDKIIRIRYAQFGKMLSIEKVGLEQLGNLNGEDIKDFLQLNLRIRNTDILLEDLLKNDLNIEESHVRELVQRVDLCLLSANKLKRSLTLKNHN